MLEFFKDTVSRKKVKNYPVHLKINTGLNRIGFSTKDVNRLINSINNDNFIKVDGCLLYTSPSPRDATLSRMPSSA